jgi:hypothetical protein
MSLNSRHSRIHYLLKKDFKVGSRSCRRTWVLSEDPSSKQAAVSGDWFSGPNSQVRMCVSWISRSAVYSGGLVPGISLGAGKASTLVRRRVWLNLVVICRIDSSRVEFRLDHVPSPVQSPESSLGLRYPLTSISGPSAVNWTFRKCTARLPPISDRKSTRTHVYFPLNTLHARSTWCGSWHCRLPSELLSFLPQLK